MSAVVSDQVKYSQTNFVYLNWKETKNWNKKLINLHFSSNFGKISKFIIYLLWFSHRPFADSAENQLKKILIKNFINFRFFFHFIVVCASWKLQRMKGQGNQGECCGSMFSRTMHVCYVLCLAFGCWNFQWTGDGVWELAKWQNGKMASLSYCQNKT